MNTNTIKSVVIILAVVIFIVIIAIIAKKNINKVKSNKGKGFIVGVALIYGFFGTYMFFYPRLVTSSSDESLSIIFSFVAIGYYFIGLLGIITMAKQKRSIFIGILMVITLWFAAILYFVYFAKIKKDLEQLNYKKEHTTVETKLVDLSSKRKVDDLNSIDYSFKCPYCGAVCDPNANFCEKCGKQVREETSSKNG